MISCSAAACSEHQLRLCTPPPSPPLPHSLFVKEGGEIRSYD